MPIIKATQAMMSSKKCNGESTHLFATSAFKKDHNCIKEK